MATCTVGGGTSSTCTTTDGYCHIGPTGMTCTVGVARTGE
jgi:hypothetical protein